MDAERRLLDYLWNTALIERLRVAGKDGKVAVHVRDLFGPDDPLTADIDSALAAPAVPDRCPVEGFHEHRFDGPHRLAAPAVTETGDLPDHGRCCECFDGPNMAAGHEHWGDEV